jgi:hypothetical protein
MIRLGLIIFPLLAFALGFGVSEYRTSRLCLLQNASLIHVEFAGDNEGCMIRHNRITGTRS